MRFTTLRRGRKTRPFMSSLRFTISRRSSASPKLRWLFGRPPGCRTSGDSLRFLAVTVETAEALCRDAERRLSKMLTRLEQVLDRPAIDLASLYDGNLISGIVRGLE
jgi:hypothetical protein